MENQRWENQTTLPSSWEICVQVKKQYLELDMEQQTSSKLEKEYVKAVYGHPAYLTYMHIEILGWIKNKLESRLLGEISITSDMLMLTTLMAGSEELKSLLMKVKEENEKYGLKLSIKKTKIMASGPLTSWQVDGKTMETMTDYFVGLQISLQMVTAALKLKNAYSWAEKL